MNTLVITVAADTPIVMSGSPDSPTDLGVMEFTEPAILASNGYAPDSPYLHGSVALSWRYQQTLLNFTVGTFGAETEAEADAMVAELRAAVSRMGYQVTYNVDGGGDKVWECDAGSVTPAGPRTWVNVKYHTTAWNVSIPVYPAAAVEES